MAETSDTIINGRFLLLVVFILALGQCAEFSEHDEAQDTLDAICAAVECTQEENDG